MPFRVLIVDDNEPFLEAASVLLERDGVQIVGVASTSADALRQAAQARPDVVLVDIMLGKESGLELSRRFDEAGSFAGGGVILISTLAEADVVDLLAESPAIGFLPKSELSARAICRIVRAGSR
jgi:DNA-binding NarL/FixJ family response regulator